MPDEELHAWVDASFASVGTYLHGRMYDTMVNRETAPLGPDTSQAERDRIRQSRAAEKVVRR